MLVNAVNSLMRVFIVTVEDYTLGGFLCKDVKAFYYVFNVLEILQMICVNIKYHRNIREKFEKMILILTGLADHYAA